MTTIHPFVVNKNKKIDITTTPIETIPSYKFFFLSKNASKTETENRNENNQQVQKKTIKKNNSAERRKTKT